jgi:phosphatidylinositol 3,5-bisphosphate 5-phosphatase
VKFLGVYYFTLITQKKKVSCIGANSIYSVKATEIFAVKPREVLENSTFRQMWKKLNKKLNQTASEIAESRYMGLFQFVDLTKDFYFSYSYDLTHSLQHNYIMSEEKKKSFPPHPAQEMFEWNHFQTEEMKTFNGLCAAPFLCASLPPTCFILLTCTPYLYLLHSQVLSPRPIGCCLWCTGTADRGASRCSDGSWT